jgi:hypothetical protein
MSVLRYFNFLCVECSRLCCGNPNDTLLIVGVLAKRTLILAKIKKLINGSTMVENLTHGRKIKVYNAATGNRRE